MSATAGVRGRLGLGLAAVTATATIAAVAVVALAAAGIVRDLEVRALDTERRAVETALALDTARMRLDLSADRRPDVREAFRDGRLVESLAWPEAIGTRAVAPRAPDAAAAGFVWSVPTAAGPRPAWVVVEPGEAPDGPMRYAGAWIDLPDGPFEALHSAHARLVPASAARGSATSEVATAAGEDPWVVAWSPATAAAVPGLAVAAVVAAVVLAVVAGVAGWWVVRAATRPLDAVVDAFDAVARGDADYDFPVSREAAFGEVVASYSRMRRALDVERERVRSVARVAAWKETARRVAHEVKNPLVPIRLTVENLVKARERAPERFEAMFASGTRAILEEVDRLGRIVSEFSAYARLPEPRRAPHDLGEIVDGIVALYDGRPDVRIRHERIGSLAALRVDRDLVGQAVRNVVDNAVRALAGSGGEVVVRTGTVEDEAFVTVRDDGPGFPPEALPHVFEPYVTARAGGTGLGLAIAHRVVVEHDGRITAGNVAGGGAEVTIRLPTKTPEDPR